MKKINISLLMIIFSLSIVHTSCDEGFEELNTSDIAINELDPVPILNHAVWRSSPYFFRHTMIYEMAIVQHMVTPFGTSLAGGNYNQENFPIAQYTWENHYENIIRNSVDIISKYKDDTNRSNIYNMARIIRVYGGMVLTDTYGDVPYINAGLGFIERNDAPVYDSQESIYMSILSELEEATASLSSDSRIESGDILYAGDIIQWKRFGYSLMLRAAMRLTKVNPALAQEYVGKAVSGGVMESNDDNAMVRHSSNFTNFLGGELNGSEAANFYMTKPLVDFFQSNDDPRLGVMAVRYVGATSGSGQTEAVATRDSNDQIGLPMGYDNNTIGVRAEADGIGSFYSYTQFDRNTIGKQTAPFFILTYAQTQFLLAEAAVRGWADGEAADYFANGIRGHMEQLEIHDSNLAIEETAINAYIRAHPLEAGSELEQINTQYWVASLFNSQEAFANFRRSGYPALVPNPYPQSSISGDFIRRLTYHTSEYTNNLENINTAINRQGPDKLDTRVWWDQ
ncbi:hypothetical protein OKW21_004143 [Catalinimonas alkaloidigena]|uniref:SusD/RagB family nutrient-binding outer membrane lipoprotein n=1 Tax=Catalinimonas alkaloidigena TaxID=1075417 RepID=UPI002406DEDB|nr:SusD/RagB family nutrient-binding outer membrane lipoprotein [Catalinimonas alkaloidigena]MDF9798880.1 hypothetical protein [Catalinimonas alkaloidigena]